MADGLQLGWVPPPPIHNPQPFVGPAKSQSVSTLGVLSHECLLAMLKGIAGRCGLEATPAACRLREQLLSRFRIALAVGVPAGWRAGRIRDRQRGQGRCRGAGLVFLVEWSNERRTPASGCQSWSEWNGTPDLELAAPD